MVTETEVSREETALNAELARIGVNVSEESVRGVVSFAAKKIDERDKMPIEWRRKWRWVAAHGIAARLAKVSGDNAARDGHFAKVTKYTAWLTKRGIPKDKLTELSQGIGERMSRGVR